MRNDEFALLTNRKKSPHVSTICEPRCAPPTQPVGGGLVEVRRVLQGTRDEQRRAVDLGQRWPRGPVAERFDAEGELFGVSRQELGAQPVRQLYAFLRFDRFDQPFHTRRPKEVRELRSFGRIGRFVADHAQADERRHQVGPRGSQRIADLGSHGVTHETHRTGGHRLDDFNRVGDVLGNGMCTALVRTAAFSAPSVVEQHDPETRQERQVLLPHLTVARSSGLQDHGRPVADDLTMNPDTRTRHPHHSTLAL